MLKLMQVLKVDTYLPDRTSSIAFVQQVTPKQIVVIIDEKTLVKFDRATGKSKNPSLANFTICKSCIDKFFFWSHLNSESWHGGWKPLRNSKGVVQSTMRPLHFYQHRSDPYEAWFNSQGVQIVNYAFNPTFPS